jgi:Ni,Fe-hydrogenase maturation factor
MSIPSRSELPGLCHQPGEERISIDRRRLDISCQATKRRARTVSISIVVIADAHKQGSKPGRTSSVPKKSVSLSEMIEPDSQDVNGNSVIRAARTRHPLRRVIIRVLVDQGLLSSFLSVADDLACQIGDVLLGR